MEKKRLHIIFIMVLCYVLAGCTWEEKNEQQEVATGGQIQAEAEQTYSESLWKIPYNTKSENAITYIAQYGEWKTPLGLYSFAVGKDKLFVDDSANQRIMVYEEDGEYFWIALPENTVCDDMVYDEKNQVLHLRMHDYLAVIAPNIYGVVDLDEEELEIECIGTSDEALERLDYKGERILSPMTYELYQEMMEMASKLWGREENGNYSIEFIDQYEEHSLFCYSERKNATMVLFWMKDGDIVAHTEWLEVGEFFQLTSDYCVYLYENNANVTVVYLVWNSDSELEIVEAEFRVTLYLNEM